MSERESRTTTRVRYPETDRMGVAHHTHHFAWFELGRTELMRDLGCPYGELEDRDGIFFPVVDAGATYRSPARYDETLEIRTRLTSVQGVRVRFEYEVSREPSGETVSTGFTVHAAVNRDGRPTRLPEPLRRRLAAAAVLFAALAILVAPGCAAKRREKKAAAEILTARSLYETAEDQIARRNFRKARSVLEKIQFSSDDRATLEPLVRLALADSMFYLGDDLSLIEARAKYLDFVTLYGDHAKAPYAQFQAGMCSLDQVANPARDQSETYVAIGDFKELLRRYPESAYAVAGRDALDHAEANLAEHEFVVGRFYLQKDKYVAAADRFRTLMEKYPRYPEREKLYFHLGKALVLGDSDSEGKAWFDRLIADYPASEYAQEAKKFLKDHEGKGTGSERASR